MVLNFSSTGEYAQAVYGGTNSQVAGANGAIATTNPNSTVMQGGRRRSRKNQSRRNQRNKSQQGGKRRQQSQRRQQRQRRQNKSQRQRGGK